MNLPFLLGSFLCLLATSSATDWHLPLFSVNTSLVQLGRPFMAHCRMDANFTEPDSYYYVDFWREHTPIVEYDHYPVTLNGTRQTKITSNPRNLTDISVRPFFYSANITAYQTEITPHSLGVHAFWCSRSGFSSKETAVTVVSSLSSATLSLGVKAPKVGVPFTASCTVSLFNTTVDTHTSYSVGFFSKRDGRLAEFEFRHGRIAGEKIVTLPKHEHVLVAQGAREVFPTFEVKITEKKGTKQEYWCNLVEGGRDTALSAHWKGA